MSQDMADKKAEEIRMLEESERMEKEAMLGDKCPICRTPTLEFPYVLMIPQVEWIECPRCGVVFSPLSSRKMKLMGSKSRTPLGKVTAASG